MSLPLPPTSARRLAFLGTPEAAVPTLAALHDGGFEVVVVVTGPDKRRGRGSKLSPSPVKLAALERELPVTSQLADVLDADVDLGVVVAYGKLIPERVLAQVPMVNLHFSALPRWRGAAPVERAILAGDETTAVSIMSVDVGLDEGDVWAQHEVRIADDENADQLRNRLAELGAELMVETIRSGFPVSVPQSGEPVYAAKIDTDDRRIDWQSPADMVMRTVRIGGAWTTFRGQRFKVWEARPTDADLGPGRLDGIVVGAGDGALELVTVQPAGKPRLDASDWVNGAHVGHEDRLGE